MISHITPKHIQYNPILNRSKHPQQSAPSFGSHSPHSTPASFDKTLIRQILKRSHFARFGMSADITFSRADQRAADALKKQWATDSRWKGVKRPYTAEDVVRVRGSMQIKHTMAEKGANRLWKLMNTKAYVHALGAVTGNQAMQMVKAGLPAIYCSGWQVAADGNLSGHVYPDQSLYPANSVPFMVKRINQALQKADQIECSEGKKSKTHWYAPIVADAEAGFGGNLNCFEIMKGMIEAGAAGVHFEDQLSSAKKCGHMGGKVLLPTREALEHLVAARLAADVMGVPTVLVARTDAESATLINSDIDERDKPFIMVQVPTDEKNVPFSHKVGLADPDRGTNGVIKTDMASALKICKEQGIDESKIKPLRTEEGFYELKGGMDAAIARGLAFAPHADVLWFETSTPDLAQAKRFADAIHQKYPGKLLAYNCSPSFNWKKKLDDATIANFQKELGKMGFKFQFVTLAGFHALNKSMFDLAKGYEKEDMAAYSRLQQEEFAMEKDGYTATKHQREVGTGYFDVVAQIIGSGKSSTTALTGSTEEAQFHEAKH